LDFLREISNCGRSGVIFNVAERFELVCQWFLIDGRTDIVLRRGGERGDQRWREDKNCSTEARSGDVEALWSRNHRLAGSPDTAQDHPLVKYANCITSSIPEYGGQETMNDAGHAGEDHFRTETRCGDQVLNIRFTDRRRVVDK
jgi:hypothetical protein